MGLTSRGLQTLLGALWAPTLQVSGCPVAPSVRACWPGSSFLSLARCQVGASAVLGAAETKGDLHFHI